jgi:hypothetical protein
MSLKRIKHVFIFLLLAYANNLLAQEDGDFQKYLDSNISTNSMKNQDLLFVRQILSTQRIKLQSKYSYRNEKNGLGELKKQVFITEKSIRHYANMHHKVIVNEQDIQKTGVDSELLLARLVYIKAYTWCMEESLNRNVKQLLEDSKTNEQVDESLVKVVNFTNDVLRIIEDAKHFDRMKYRYNKKGVITKWNYTFSLLQKKEKNIIDFAPSFRREYRILLVDLKTMIVVLSII